MPIMTRRVFRAGLLAAALSAVGAGASPAQAFRAVVRFRAYPTPVALDSLVRPYEFEAPLAKTFSAVAWALDRLNVKSEVRDTTQWVLGTHRWVRSSTLAGERASMQLNCGQGILGPNADRFRLTVAFVALFDSVAPELTKVGFALVGEGQDVAGASIHPSACASTGLLESRIADMVNRRLREMGT